MKKYNRAPLFKSLFRSCLFVGMTTALCVSASAQGKEKEKTMSATQFKDGYDNAKSIQDSDVQEGMDKITKNGRTLEFTADTISVGNICRDCDQAELAAMRGPSYASGGSACRFYNNFKANGVPEEPLKQALFFYQKNRNQFNKQRYISIADYSQKSTRKRFYILDMQTGAVRKEKVSHGSGNRNGVKVGDPNHDGIIDRCHHGNNINDRTNMTRAGFFATRNFYHSASHNDKKSFGGQTMQEWPYLDSNGSNGLRMVGLSPGVNDEALNSGVVMHGAWYNDIASTMGRSYGCPAFQSKVAPSVLRTLRGGTLYYSYTPRCRELHAKVEKQVRGWQGMCN